MGTMEKIIGSLNNYSVLLVVLLLLLFFIIDKFVQRNNNLSDTILALAILYLSKPFTDIQSILLNWIQNRLGLPQSESNLSHGSFIWVGVLLLLIAIILKIKESPQKYPLLNMLGIHFQAYVNHVGCNDKLSKNEFLETVIDFTFLFDKPDEISKSNNKKICDDIQKKCSSLVGIASNSKRAYFTGMSPIPYEVYAGTFLNGSKVNDYLEYDSKNTKKFYELKNRCSIQQKLFGIHTLAKEVSENLIETEDLNLIISVSSKITDEDLFQFRSFSNAKLELNEIKDNVIKEKEQLIELKNKISSLMEEYGKKGFKRIHITAAIPSCLAVEIGKEIAQLGNRLPEIVVYHHVKTAETKYPFGLIVNGSDKGNLYHV